MKNIFFDLTLDVLVREQLFQFNKNNKMSIRLGDIAPDFSAQTTLGNINFHEWLENSWGIIFSHPADFTPVCTTELGAVANLSEEFKKRNVKVIALSVDSIESHYEWIKDINETQNTFVDFPIIADPEFVVSQLFGFVHPNASDRFTVRSVVIIGPDKKVKLLITYPASTGRNFDEILRVIDSLQLTAQHSVATPANWSKGDDVVIAPSISDSDAQVKFPQGFKTIKPYLRLTKIEEQ
jgi:alkyl hydroperoxide reductase subunit AhpC